MDKRKNEKFIIKDFIFVALITSIWIHVGEIFRAMVVAFPLMKQFFGDRIAIGSMSIGNAIVWGIWDTLLAGILVFMLWLCMEVFDSNHKAILISATVSSLATIGVFWIAMVNTGLGEWSTAFTIFPIAWIEMLIGSYIALKLYSRRKRSRNRKVDYNANH